MLGCWGVRILWVEVFDENSLVLESDSPQRHGGHRERDLFFVHREIPMDEKSASNQIYDMVFF